MSAEQIEILITNVVLIGSLMRFFVAFLIVYLVYKLFNMFF